MFPPARADRDPVSHLSPVGALSWCRWTWESTPPGVTYAPAASMTFALRCSGSDRAIVVMIPDLIPIESPGERTSVAVTLIRRLQNLLS